MKKLAIVVMVLGSLSLSAGDGCNGTGTGAVENVQNYDYCCCDEQCGFSWNEISGSGTPEELAKKEAFRRIMAAFKDAISSSAFLQAQLMAKINMARAFGVLINQLMVRLAPEDQRIIADILAVVRDCAMTIDEFMAKMLATDLSDRECSRISREFDDALRTKLECLWKVLEPLSNLTLTDEEKVMIKSCGSLLIQDLGRTIAMGCDVGIAELAQ
jgi:hypothetical protein